MKIILVLFVMFLQGCAGGGSTSSPGPAPGEPNPPPVSRPGTPPVTRPESGDFFVNVDQEIAASATGDKLTSERFITLMSRLSVYALICDAKNDKGYSTQFSQAYNRATELQALALRVYGGEKPTYNRFEKQRNIESRRLSFESAPNVCALSEQTFAAYIALPADQLTAAIKTTPRGSF